MRKDIEPKRKQTGFRDEQKEIKSKEQKLSEIKTRYDK